MNYQEMCDRRAAASAENTALLSFEEGTKASDAPILTDDQRELSNKLETEIATLTTNITAYEADQVRRDRQTALTATLATTTRLPSTKLQPPTVNDPPAAGNLTPDNKDKPWLSFPRTYGQLKGFKGPDAAEHAYKSGQFLLAAIGNDRAALWCREYGVQMLTPQGEDSNQRGGFLVPPEFETAIIDLREEFGVFRRESKVVPMASNTMTIPRRKSGLTAFYIGESEEITESNKTWNQVELVARKLGCLTKYSSELNEDAIINMASDLAGEMAYAFAVKEDAAGFNGAGESTNGGITGLKTACTAATATVVTAETGNDKFSNLDLLEFENMIGKLPLFAHAGAKWFISNAGWSASMQRLLDAAGGNTGMMLAGAAPKSFLGFPVVLSQTMEARTTGTGDAAGACYLGNLTLASTFGNRRGVTIKTSDQRFIEEDQLAIMGTERYDIVVHDVGDTSDAGAMVMLTFAS